MKRTVGFTASLLALLLLAFSISAQAEVLTATVGLSPGAEVSPNPAPPANASGGMLVTINVTRDNNGAITAATMNFLGTVSFPGGAITIVGLHIHENDITNNGNVVFNTGLSGTNPLVFAGGSGLINVNVANVDLVILGRLLAKPSGFYVNLHTSVNQGGAIRGQIVRLVETQSVSVQMTTAQEFPPITGVGSGMGTITINPVRNPATGAVTGGTVAFTVQHDIPAGSVITGLHIHEGPAGAAAGVVINTGLGGGANSITTASGKGTINIEVPITTAAAIGALQRLLANPVGFYVNLHTMDFGGGIIRGQLVATAAPLVIQQSNTYFLETGATDAQIALLISSSDLASVLTSTVLVNGQQVAAQLDLTTGAFNVTIPAALRANAGTLFVQARGATGLLSAPLRIVVAPAASVNTFAITTTDAAKFIPLAAPEAIVAGFGTKLASQTLAATSQPLPISLDGTSVYVNGVAARLFFVSPNQVNYLIPVGALPGASAIVAVARDGTVSRGVLNISESAPGIFTANSQGTGAPAALASADGANFNIVMGNLNGTPNEISAGNFVALFVTGVRYGSTPATITIGATSFPALFAGAQSGFAGLDQINLQVPLSLAGAGETNLTFTLDGKTSNPVRLKIK